MLNSISLKEFKTDIFSLFDDDWFLLTSGNFQTGHFNCMTISWGSLGTIWNRPFAQVAVRPTRYTFEFIDNYPDFSLCGFSKNYRPALQILGAKSGRDGNKIAQAGLTPVSSTMIGSPSFAEASLVLECRKMYSQDMDPHRFLDPGIMNNYSKQDYHRLYFGEILELRGSEKYFQQN